MSSAGSPPVTGSFETAEQLLRADSATLASALQIPMPEARREIQMLLRRALGVDLSMLLAHPELVPKARETHAYSQALARRLGGEPMAYIVNEREFYGLRFEVSPAVLIPRPETELLVEMALERLPEAIAATVLDIGTGSGCVAIAIAKLRPRARIIASDLCEPALAVAERNARRQCVSNVELRLGSWFEPHGDERFDLIVSNPPYLAQDDPHLRYLPGEPQLALVAGQQGLEALRAIVLEAPRHLLPGGSLIVEHGHDQAESVARLFQRGGFGDVVARTDIAGIQRAVGGRLP